MSDQEITAGIWERWARQSREPVRRLAQLLALSALLLGLALLLSPATVQATGHVIYVNDDASGTNDGSSWADAYPDLQQALEAAAEQAANGSPVEVWVAVGTYTPTTPADPNDPRTASFELASGVAVYGGFAGTETSRDQRDWTAHETILSGDQHGDDTGTVAHDEPTRQDNSYHVVTVSSVDATGVLDGVTITGGNANSPDDYSPSSWGGGLYIDRASPTLANLTVTGNSAILGGGLYVSYGSPTLTNLTINGNQADSGGGLFQDEGRLVMGNSLVSGNRAAGGGGIMILASSDSSSARLSQFTIRDNHAGRVGGGLFALGSEITLTDGTISGNQALEGGGVFNIENLTLTNVTISDNQAEYGGGVFHDTDRLTVTGGTISGNQASVNGGGIFVHGESTYPDWNTVTLTEVTIRDNHADGDGGGVYGAFGGAYVTLTEVTIRDNHAGGRGGGLFNDPIESLTLTNVTVLGNQAADGGGLYLQTAHRDRNGPTLTNVVVVGNHATGNGGGAYLTRIPEEDPTRLTNITVSGNQAALGGGIYSTSAGLALHNAIVWGNRATSDPAAAELWNDESSSTVIASSLVGGGCPAGATCSNVLDADPRFVRNPDPGDGDWATRADNDYGDLHLHGASPAIDVGSNDLLPPDRADLDGDGDTAEVLPFDRDGNPRVAGLAVDLGPYETEPLVLYVNDDAAGANDGTSWADAYPDLQQALSAAAQQMASGNRVELWVAAGTYTPTTPADPNDPRTASFELASGVAVYGGFAGSETSRDQRDWTAHETILSGDQHGDDTGTVAHDEPTRQDNSYHVVTVSSVDATGVLDGVTITGGNANGPDDSPSSWGGGLYTFGGGCTLANLTVIGNSARQFGGGLTIDGFGQPILINSNIVSNTARLGGGIHILGSPTLTNVTISSNQAEYGGGLYYDMSDPTLTNVTISGNHAAEAGGGLFSYRDSTSTLTNVTIIDNHSDGNGGGVAAFVGTSDSFTTESLHLTDVTISRNSAAGDGGGLYHFVDNGAVALTSVTISDNLASGSGGGMYFSGSPQDSLTLADTTFSGNQAEYGGGVYNHDGGATLTNVTLRDNSAANDGGGLYNTGPITVTNTMITGNSAGQRGGGWFDEVGSLSLTNATVAGNRATYDGGGIYSSGGYEVSRPSLTNVILSGNTAGNAGGGMYNEWGTATVTQVTVRGNEARQGGGLYNGAGETTLTNVTLTGNQATFGGAAYTADGTLRLGNALLSGNHATADGGGVFKGYSSSATLVNVTVSGNQAAGNGGGVYAEGSGRTTVHNSILWGNEAAASKDAASAQIHVQYHLPAATIEHALIAGGCPRNATCSTVLDADPRFVRNPSPGADGTWGTADDDYGDLHPLGDSPAINAGSNDLLPPDTADLDGDADTAEPLPVDRDGDRRVISSLVDLGAYEVLVTVHYVDDTAGGANTGTSWANASTDLQPVLAAAQPGDRIWVAAGTYTPTTGTDRSQSFHLQKGVALVGGFPNGGGPRDPAAHPTILSGDIGTPGDPSDNSYHVVVANGVDGTAVLDGFTVTGGQANGTGAEANGAGLYLDGGRPELVNLTIVGNTASGNGGGLYSTVGAPTLTDSRIGNNSADQGGGLYVASGTPLLTNVTIGDNHAGQDGGGLYVADASPTLTNVTLQGNRAGDLSIDAPSLDPAGQRGGGLFLAGGELTLTNATLGGNAAPLGSAAYAASGSLTLHNSIVWDNHVVDGAQIIAAPESTTTVTSSIVRGGCPVNTRCEAVQETDPRFVRTSAPGPDGLWGTADDDPGDLHLRADSPAIDAGDNAVVTATTDRDGEPRLADLPTTPDTGQGEAPIVDLGADEVPPPATLTVVSVEPSSPTNGSQVTVTVGVTTAAGQPVADGLPIRFAVTGSNPATARPNQGETRTVGGQASFTYTNTAVGTDTVRAYYDADGSGDFSEGEPTVTVAVTWQSKGTGSSGGNATDK